jgi:hypothetical protein
VTTLVWAGIYVVQVAFRSGKVGAGGGGEEEVIAFAVRWVRVVEALNLLLLCVQSAGGDFVAVLRIILLTFTGGHFKTSMREHALFLCVFACTRLLQVSLSVLLGGVLSPGLETALGLLLPLRREESVTSTVMLQTVSVFASIFYAMRSHEEARSRFAMLAAN